jgi:hypothetical protein
MNIKECEICGCEFKALTLGQKYCSDCNSGLYKSIANEEKAKPHKNPNQKLMDEVKAAAKAGLSYGNYKGRGNG